MLYINNFPRTRRKLGIGDFACLLLQYPGLSSHGAINNNSNNKDSNNNTNNNNDNDNDNSVEILQYERLNNCLIWHCLMMPFALKHYC